MKRALAATAPGPGVSLWALLKLLDARIQQRLASRKPKRAPKKVPGDPAAPPPAPALALAPGPVRLTDTPTACLAALRDAALLTPFELDLVLLALAPEADPRFSRGYALVQDDPTRPLLTVGVALDLLCGSDDERLARRAHFSDAAVLFRLGVLVWLPETAQASLIGRPFRLAPGLVEPLLDDDDSLIAAAVKDQAGRELASLTRHLPLLQDWDDLVLPPDASAQLHELCAQVQQREQVLLTWGLGDKLAFGRGVAALFSGPSGTGKTMAAAVVSRHLARELYRIDLSQVVSKYIGETEKNLGRIFDCAAKIDAVLFFDEADALFGKRSEVKDSHDRYANIEVGYLLQKMEEYEGLTILATNLRRNLDTALLRRLNVVVEFPFPDDKQRLRIWQRMFPPQVPLADDVDFAKLAHELRLSGGHLRNIALAAASLAASESTSIHQTHLLHAARREYEKQGQSWPSHLSG